MYLDTLWRRILRHRRAGDRTISPTDDVQDRGLHDLLRPGSLDSFVDSDHNHDPKIRGDWRFDPEGLSGPYDYGHSCSSSYARGHHQWAQADVYANVFVLHSTVRWLVLAQARRGLY